MALVSGKGTHEHNPHEQPLKSTSKLEKHHRIIDILILMFLFQLGSKIIYKLTQTGSIVKTLQTKKKEIKN
ncbi:hypothetical protein AAZX31_03G122800 [Glycine max]